MSTKKYILLFCMGFVIMVSQAQNNSSTDSINQTDKQGLKQGFWIKKYPNGNIMYQGYFIDDKPAKLMKRFYENGEIKSTFLFYNNNKSCAAHIYYPDSLLMAMGTYKNGKRDSLWRFYSDQGPMVLQENYNEESKILKL